MFERSMWSNKNPYSALPADSVVDPDDGEGSGRHDFPSPQNQSNALSVLVIVCALCTITNLVIPFVLPSIISVPPRHLSITRDNIHLLRRPSQYIRLDEVIRSSPPVPKQFNNYPMLLATIDKSQPDKVSDDDPKRHMTHVGMISPEDRQVLVTETVSTIIQFRAIDFGMEICELHVVLPPIPSSATLPDQAMLSLLRLNASQALSPKSLSYKNRPPRLFKLTDIPLISETGSHWHRKFACSSEEVLSFELACLPSDSSHGCRVEWWQDKESGKDRESSIFVKQHSTV